MKKKIIIYDKYFINLQKNIILKNSINSIFLKKLKFLNKKNIFLNYFFYNKFIKVYKYNNLNKYLNYFLFNKTNIFYIYNLNIFRKQFAYDLNSLKFFFKDKDIKFLFLKKNINKNYFFNNCFFINNQKNNFELKNNFLENITIIKFNNLKYNNNLTFISFNFYLFNVIEIYKILIFIFYKSILIN